MKFVAWRRVYGGVAAPTVHVATSLLAAPNNVCVRSFRKVFGFTPRKGKAYAIEISGVKVTEIEPRNSPWLGFRTLT